jgi:hypothetical protein
MRAIEGVATQDLVAQAAQQLIDEQKHAAVNQIKDVLKRIAQLSNDLKTMQESAAKKEKELNGAKGMLEKLRAGDWSVLCEIKAEAKQP